MFLVKLSFKNLTRHKKRALITAAVIALAVFFYIFLDSMMLGMKNESFRSIIDFESSHIQVADSEYWDNRNEMPLDNLLEYDQDLIDSINQAEGVKAYSPHLKFRARLNNGIDELPIGVRSVIPGLEKEVYEIEKYFVSGEFFQPGQSQAVMGKELAELMDLNQGDYFTLLMRTNEGTFNTLDLKIAGLIHTPNPNINSNTIFIPLTVAQRVLNTENKISQVAVRLNNRKLVPDTVQGLTTNLQEGVKAFTWRDSASSLINLTRAQSMENKIILTIILIIAAVGIINTVILAGIERIEEIGMMKAMGMKEKEIITTFVLESTGIGIIGGVLGCLGAFIAVALFHKYGIDFFALAGGEEIPTFGFPIIGRIYGGWNPSSFIFMFLFSVVLTTIVSIFPAIWAAKKDVIKAIHHR